MAFFAATALVPGHRQGRVVEPFFEHSAQLAEAGLAQADFHRFEIAHPLVFPLRFD